MKNPILFGTISMILYCTVTPMHWACASDTQAEISALKEQITQLQQALVRLEKEVAKGQSSFSNNGDKEDPKEPSAQVSVTPSLKVVSADGNYSFQAFGRVHADYAFFADDKTDHPDGATFRRARLGFKGDLGEDFNYKAEVDFGNKDSDDSVSLKDVYLAYTGLDHFTIRAGNFKPALGLEEITSSNYLTFIEDSAPTQSFTTGEILGVQMYHHGERYSWALGLHNDATTSKSSDDEAKSIIGRMTYLPWLSEQNLFHVGISGGRRIPDSSTDAVDFDATAENALQRRQSVETGTIAGIDHVDVLGMEAAFVSGPFSLQGEYFITAVDREQAQDLHFTGWYGQASWLLTGESRPYKKSSGSFGRIKPFHPFNLKENTWGAWELAARYSYLDLNDHDVQGGKLEDITIGVNWYLHDHIRLMANYIFANSDEVTPAGNNVAADDDPQIVLLRAQFDF